MSKISVQIRMLEMELVSPFETSFGAQDSRDVLLLTVKQNGLTGWGECTAHDDPIYSAETPIMANYILEAYLIPALLEGTISGDPRKFHQEAAFIRGNNMAKATLEAALWDLEAKKQGQPLAKLFGGSREEVFTGVSVGIQPSIEKLVEVVGGYIDDGYRRIKIKIKHGWDLLPVAALKKAYPDMPLMVDANCAYTMADLPMLKEMDKFGLMMIEQPFHYEDLVDHAKLQSEISTAVCIDESAHSVKNVETALALGSCKLVNIKQGRLGGPSQAMQVHDICQAAGIGVWAGGMLETGIGRALNIALASKENFTIPGDISASNRYWHKDIIVPEVEVSKNGSIIMPTGPGLGYEPDLAHIDKLTIDSQLFEEEVPE
jgi:O-succinylbenzoate synthase